ncbi:MAG: hypothetical protein AB8C95_01175 [Phycisphaeraceae bacterium]
MNWQIAQHRLQPEVEAVPQRPLSNLRAVVLLAGDVRTNTLRKLTGRASPSLPVGANRTVLDCWREQLITLAETLGIEQLPVRVLISRNSGLTPRTERFGPVLMSIEYDPSSFRGTAGLLSDIARSYEDDDQLLVTSAGQILFEPLIRIALDLYNTGGDFTLGVDPSGVPSGLMLFRCGCMRGISSVGFCDLNEQALPEMARSHQVRVAQFASPAAMSVRTLPSYLNALRVYHRHASGRHDLDQPFEEHWRPTFGIVEPGASIGRGVIVHDSVVLAGAKVESGAVLVRSVVCPGATVGRDARVIDKVLSGSGGVSL